MIAILIKEVLLKEEDDSLSGGLELVRYIVYGIGAFGTASLSAWMFWNFDHFIATMIKNCERVQAMAINSI